MKKLLVFFSLALILSGCFSTYSEDPYYNPTAEKEFLNVEADKQGTEWAIEQDAEKFDAASDAQYDDRIEQLEKRIEEDEDFSGDNSPDISQDEGCPNGCSYHKSGCDIKGNISIGTEEKIYHVPGGEFYNATEISPEYGERWFCTEAEAKANGWRKSKK